MSRDSARTAPALERNYRGIPAFQDFLASYGGHWPAWLGCLAWPTWLSITPPVSSCRVTLHALWGCLWKLGIGNQNQKVKVRSFERKGRMYSISPTHKNSKTERPARFCCCYTWFCLEWWSDHSSAIVLAKAEFYSNAKMDDIESDSDFCWPGCLK